MTQLRFQLENVASQPQAELSAFEIWLKELDEVVRERLGLSHLDLPDYCWAEIWESGVTPAEALEDYLLEMEDLL